MSYNQLRPVIAINILNFSLFEQTEQFHTTYHLYENEERFRLTDVMEFHFIEMAKLIKYWKEDKLDPWNNILARWLLMLGMVDHRNEKVYNDIYQELEEIAMKDESLRQAFENWEELSMTHEQYLAYESRLKRLLDEESFRVEMERLRQEIEQNKKEIKQSEQNIKQSEQNIKQKAEQASIAAEQKAKETIARRLLEKEMTMDEVSEFTDLPLGRVRKIKRKMEE